MDEDLKKQKLRQLGQRFGDKLEDAMRTVLERAGKLNKEENAGITFKEVRTLLMDYGLEEDVFENFVYDSDELPENFTLDMAVDW